MDFSTHVVLGVKEMFLGKQFIPLFLLEVIFRTTFMYLYTLINIRLFHSQNIAQLTSFELIIVIALGAAVGDPMFYPTTPMIYGMITITTIIIITKLITTLTEKSDTFELLVEGKPIMVIKHGELVKENLHSANISPEELFSFLRLRGIKNVGQVEYAFIETSGQVSVIEYAQPKQGISTLDHFTD